MNIKTGVSLYSAARPATGRPSASHYARLQPASRTPDSLHTSFLVKKKSFAQLVLVFTSFYSERSAALLYVYYDDLYILLCLFLVHINVCSC